MSIVWYSVVLVFLHQAGCITASVEWPVGFYGLLKPDTGCPEEWTEKQWEQNCFINQDTVNHKPDNNRSEVLHIDGNVNPSDVERHFCLKTKWYGKTTWPKGQYCVYSKFGRQGMRWGSIRMYNEWYRNQDNISTSCRDFFYGNGTKHIDLHFACQTSGNKKIPISLPITKPFYLLPYGSRDCQQVQWMVATSEWIWYQTRNYKGRYYKQKTVPYHKLGANSRDRGIKMYYCYYKSCNSTLNDTSGVFQSPGFPGNYPDGQLCSWRIMVPDNHALRVQFTNFSLYEYDKDCFQLYENDNGIFKPRQAFFGHQGPFIITATADLVFVFKSDEKYNSYGFRAEYTILDITPGIWWPDGNYGLLKPISGCPQGFDGRAFVFQDTVDTNPSNNRSDILHIDGYVGKGEVLKYFCTRYGVTSSYNMQSPRHWPDGQYCIYRDKQSTLNGMESGSMRMYDEENNNKDTFKMNNHVFVSIKTWWSEDHTSLHFACQTRGNKNIPISLPITIPFYLLPYESRDCQQVQWMVATSEWIKYHTRKNTVQHDTAPYVELGNDNSDGVTIYYCYYKSCVYTLRDKKGVFQSPGFPGKYPDGQLCSWRIMVPDNHTLHVRFINFSLNGSDTDDYLRFFTKINGTNQINKTFFGMKEPFNVTATSEVKFLFRSDEDGNSYGFRAEYRVFKSRGDYTKKRPNPSSRATSLKTMPTTGATTFSHSTMLTSVKSTASDLDNGDSKKSPHSTDWLGTRSRIITAIVAPLAFVTIGILLVIIILYRCSRSKGQKHNTSDARESMSMDQPKNMPAANTDDGAKTSIFPPTSHDTPEYESPDDLKEERSSKHHADIDIDAPEYHVLEPIGNRSQDNDGRQIYQSLSSDHDQQPEYEALNYSKHRDTDPGIPEYHELEPIGNEDPDVVYHVLEGPDSNDGSPGDQILWSQDNNTTDNPLYQYTTPGATVTENPLYDISGI